MSRSTTTASRVRCSASSRRDLLSDTYIDLLSELEATSGPCIRTACMCMCMCMCICACACACVWHVHMCMWHDVCGMCHVHMCMCMWHVHMCTCTCMCMYQVRTDAVTGRATVVDRDKSKRQGGSSRLLAALGEKMHEEGVTVTQHYDTATGGGTAIGGASASSGSGAAEGGGAAALSKLRGATAAVADGGAASDGGGAAASRSAAAARGATNGDVAGGGGGAVMQPAVLPIWMEEQARHNTPPKAGDGGSSSVPRLPELGQRSA
jgi:hypothetical protein